MFPPDLLKNLKLDNYYMVLVYLGAISLILSLFVPTQWLSNKDLGLIASGFFFIGLGEWKNHKVKYTITNRHVTGVADMIGPTKMEHIYRQPDFIGYLFILIGILLILGGLYNVFFA